jgi:hypothetical protein
MTYDFLALGFRGRCTMYNFTLKIATTMFVEALENLKKSNAVHTQKPNLYYHTTTMVFMHIETYTSKMKLCHKDNRTVLRNDPLLPFRHRLTSVICATCRLYLCGGLSVSPKGKRKAVNQSPILGVCGRFQGRLRVLRGGLEVRC